MAAAATVTRISDLGNAFLVQGSIALSGNYGTESSHGDALDLSKLGVPTNQKPTFVQISEMPASGTTPTDHLYAYCPGTTQANGVVCILVLSTMTEYTEAAAYSTNFGNPIVFTAIFPSL